MEAYQIYVFETRCRKCGIISERYFAKVGQIDVFTFQRSMQEFVDSPKVYVCTACGQDTVGDVLCFGKKSPKSEPTQRA